MPRFTFRLFAQSGLEPPDRREYWFSNVFESEDIARAQVTNFIAESAPKIVEIVALVEYPNVAFCTGIVLWQRHTHVTRFGDMIGREIAVSPMTINDGVDTEEVLRKGLRQASEELEKTQARVAYFREKLGLERILTFELNEELDKVKKELETFRGAFAQAQRDVEDLRKKLDSEKSARLQAQVELTRIKRALQDALKNTIQDEAEESWNQNS